MKTMLAFIVLVVCTTSGCGFAARHPTQVKVYALVGGAAIGAGFGMTQRVTYCHYSYDGQPYYGTTCDPQASARPQHGRGR